MIMANKDFFYLQLEKIFIVKQIFRQPWFENAPFHTVCEFAHCEPHTAEMFAQLLLIDIMLTPKEIAAERERLERMKS